MWKKIITFAVSNTTFKVPADLFIFPDLSVIMGHQKTDRTHGWDLSQQPGRYVEISESF